MGLRTHLAGLKLLMSAEFVCVASVPFAGINRNRRNPDSFVGLSEHPPAKGLSLVKRLLVEK